MSPSPKRGRFFIADDDPASKRAILEAALRLFVEHGLSATNVRMIGAAAGYSNPAMFKFFETKEALSLYLFERCYARLFVDVHAAASAPAFDDALSRVVNAFLGAMDRDLEATLFVQDSLRELWPKLAPSARKGSILRTLAVLFRRGMAEGKVRGYAKPTIPVAVLVGTMAQLGRMLYFREAPGPAGRHRQAVELAMSRMLGG